MDRGDILEVEETWKLNLMVVVIIMGRRFLFIFLDIVVFDFYNVFGG